MRNRIVRVIAGLSLLIGLYPPPLPAQPAAQGGAEANAQPELFSEGQLDSLMAPIALYPDALLTPLLMATTYPLELVAAARWLEADDHKNLKGAALETALKPMSWDPSVKSLVPFPAVLEMLDKNLDWTQQLGYAMQVQEGDAFGAVQRLRLRAQQAGNLKSGPELMVRTEPAPAPPPDAPPPPPDQPSQVIVIEPAQPQTVYVPAYDPSVVYGTWPYPAYPPVYYPPPAGYYAGAALVSGLAFGAGVAITAGLWGWARPNWGCCYGGWGGWGRYGYSNINVNVNRYNQINVNRHWNGAANGGWRPQTPNYRPGQGWSRPGGPVGRPSQPGRPGYGTPARPGGAGRPSVSVPGNVVRPPSGMGPGHNRPPISRPGAGQGAGQRPGQGNRPGVGQGQRPGAGAGSRPGAGQGGRPGGVPGGGYRPGPGQGARPGGAPGMTRPAPGARPSPPAFSGRSQGARASSFSNRGAQSLQSRGGARPGGGMRPGGGRGRGR